MKGLLKIFIILIILFSTSCIQENEWQNLTILHTNDIHGALISRPSLNRGSIAKIATYIKKIRKIKDEVLVVDSGDLHEKGSLPDGLSKGKVMRNLMKMLGYDLRLLGNHDFRFGIESIVNSLNGTNTPAVISNLNWSRPEQITFYRHYIVQAGKARIGFIGITIGPRIYATGIETDDYDVQAEINALRAKDVDVIIALTHIGYEEDKLLREKLNNIDLIIGGHSDTTLKRVNRGRSGNEIPIVHAGSFARAIGHLDLRINIKKNRLIIDDYRLVSLIGDDVIEDPEVKEVISRAYREYAPFGLDPIKSFEKDIRKRSIKSMQLATAAMAYTTESDAALFWKNPIRTDLKKGEVSTEDLFIFAPIIRTGCGGQGQNHVYTIHISGDRLSKLKEAFNKNLLLYARVPSKIEKTRQYKVAVIKTMLDKQLAIFKNIDQLPDMDTAHMNHNLQDTNKELHETLITFLRKDD